MTEEELVQAFKAVLKGERQRIQKAAHTLNHRQLREETYSVRSIFNSIHPNGASVVDNWISEAKDVR